MNILSTMLTLPSRSLSALFSTTATADHPGIRCNVIISMPAYFGCSGPLWADWPPGHLSFGGHPPPFSVFSEMYMPMTTLALITNWQEFNMTQILYVLLTSYRIHGELILPPMMLRFLKSHDDYNLSDNLPACDYSFSCLLWDTFFLSLHNIASLVFFW